VPRDRTSSRLTVWLFAALLLAKSAVPFAASAAAQLHGKGVAEVCPIYGVALPVAPAVDPHAAHHHHAAHPVDAAAAPHDGATPGSGDGPARHDARGGDHCVLTALATFAADTAAAAAAPPSSAATTLPGVVASGEIRPVADAAARWASLLGHGPPHRS